MQSLTQDRGASGRSIAALALGKGDDAASLEALRDALKDKDPVVRASAVHSLAMRNDPSVREALVPLMEDKKEKVRYWAAVTYLRLDKVAEEAQASATHNGDDGDVVLPAKKPTRNR